MLVDTTLKSGTVLEGRYGVLREITAGSTSRVYEGRQTNLGLSIIIKTLSEVHEDPLQASQQIEGVALEARILAALDHPNLLAVHDCFMHEGLPIMICEMVEGRRLTDIVELAPRTLAAKRVMAWCEQMLDVLSYLHNRDPIIVVRDLKPSNIILGRDGRLRLIDFSLAKRMSEKGAGTQEIMRGVGTDGYAPLEQTAFARTGPSTDLYSLGATLYYLLTKTAPVPAAQRAIAAKEPLLDPRELNPTVSDDLWQAIQKLMAVRPQDRPQTVAEARDLLLPQQGRRTGRRCLDCDLALDAFERQGVEIDQCAACGGVWLDRNELERLIELGSDEGAAAKERLADAPTQRLTPDVSGTVRLDDLEIPASSKVWQFFRDVLGRTK